MLITPFTDGKTVALAQGPPGGAPPLLFSEHRVGAKCLGHLDSVNQRCLQSTNEDRLPLYAVASCT